MKQSLSFFAALLFCIPIFAQDSVKVAVKKIEMRKYPIAKVGEASRAMSLGEGNGLVMVLPNTDAKMVSKIWTKQLKELKAKVNTNKQDEIFGDNAAIAGIGSGVDVYTKITQMGGDAEVVAFFSTEDGFVQSEKMVNEFRNAKDLLLNLDKNVSIAKVTEELEMEQKSLKRVEKDQRELEGELASYRSSVEKKKKEITELEQKAVDNQKMQVTRKEEIAKQIKRVTAVMDELKKY